MCVALKVSVSIISPHYKRTQFDSTDTQSCIVQKNQSVIREIVAGCGLDAALLEQHLTKPDLSLGKLPSGQHCLAENGCQHVDSTG